MHARTHLFHQFKYLSGELNPILLLAFFLSLLYRSLFHLLDEQAQQRKTDDDTCVRGQKKKKKKHESSSIFDNSVIVHIKGDAIIYMTSYYSRSSYFVFVHPYRLISILFLHLTIHKQDKNQGRERDCTHALCLSHLFKTNSSLYSVIDEFTRVINEYIVFLLNEINKHKYDDDHGSTFFWFR